MKELLKGTYILLCAIFVSVFMYTIGIIYSLGYAAWLSISLKDWKAFFKFWWKLIDGFGAAIGHVFYEMAYALDLTWNVNGELLEDMMTHEENTTFTEKNISVSASIGKLEKEKKLNRFGRFFSKLLNLFFLQKRHALDSWNYYIDHKQFKKNYFN